MNPRRLRTGPLSGREDLGDAVEPRRPLHDTGAPAGAAGVTVAIPNWNHECLLPRSVGSALRTVRILRAHHVAAEVLVIDDSSRDGSLQLLRQLEALHYDDGLRVLGLARNCGLPAVRNTALRVAAYRYVTFMDADNELLSENLYHFYRAIIQTQAAVVYGNLISRPHSKDDTRRPLLSNESPQARIFTANYIDAFALVDRVQIIEAGGYLESEQVKAREDWELYLHLAASGRKIVFVPLIFGYYAVLPGSMTDDERRSTPAQMAYMKRVFDQINIRSRLPMRTRHLRYHPDVGYI
jgi:glycosyltransferase involved in cell wall biosynthesis